MELSTILAEPLWAAIQKSYEDGNYCGAILDAMYYLGDYIREKTGLDSDGAALVGEAFGGQPPKLKVNQLKTESQRNVQKGILSILQGMYTAIRNPRSHGKTTDSKEDADSIILFLDYLVRVIGASKGAFSKSDFLGKVFDKSFVPNKRYAELLVEQIPKRYRLEVMNDVFLGKGEAAKEINKLSVFTAALLAALDEEEVSSLVETVSEELSVTESRESVRITVNMFPSDFWLKLSEPARMRSENFFLQSIAEGSYDVAEKKCSAGVMGTWCGRIVDHFLLKEEFLQTLVGRLGSTRGAQDYVFQFFSMPLLTVVDEQLKAGKTDWAYSALLRIIKSGLKAGDKRFYELAEAAIEIYEGPWVKQLKADFDSFKEVPPEEPEVIPF
jgi:uncharacterized protein (TIGR02391 family)